MGVVLAFVTNLYISFNGKNDACFVQDLPLDMTIRPRNSMAAALSVLMTAVIWVTALVGGLTILLMFIGVISLGTGVQFPAIATSFEENFQLFDLLFGLISVCILVPGIVYVAISLRRILTTLAEGDPFVPDNATRLTRIAIALAAMELAAILLIIVARLFFPATEYMQDLSISFDLVVWAAVAALLILSQVFREGTRLRDEEKMTI